MKVDPEKVKDLIETLSDDQRKLLQEGLANGDNLDPCKLAAVFNSVENQQIFRNLADDDLDTGLKAKMLPDKPLTRW